MPIDPGRDPCRPPADAGDAWPPRVRERMTAPVVTVTAATSVETALRLMRAHRVRHLPVIDDAERLVGMLSDRDLHALPASASIGSAMKRGPISIAPGADILTAAHLMGEHAIGAIPVVDGERVVGILTRRDVIRVLSEYVRRPPHVSWWQPGRDLPRQRPGA